ncbi:MAG: integrase, partial [Halothiobacillaceae bacterium]
MSRNYGLGSRDMARAGRFAVNAAARDGAMSFASAATIGDRWAQFCEFARDEGIKRMEDVTRDVVIAYAQTLGDLSPATAQNYVSAINTVMTIATRGEWESISPVRDCGLENRSTARTDAVPTRDQVTAAIATIADERLSAVATLMHEFGLRSKEASLLDARAAYAEAS